MKFDNVNKAARILRVNTTSLRHAVTPTFNGASPSMKRDMGAYAPKPKRPGAAGAPSFSRLTDPEVYTTGMGEVGAVDRPGSLVAYALPSRGIGA